MKIKITILLLVISTAVFAQDSIKSKDTAFVPVYEKYDTVKASFLYVDATNTVKYGEGSAILKGFAVKRGSGFSWAEQPKVFAVLDSKKQLVKKVLQIL